MESLRLGRWKGKRRIQILILNLTFNFNDSVLRDVYSMLGQDEWGQKNNMFEMMDKDKDGKITQDEFDRASMADVELNRMLTTKSF